MLNGAADTIIVGASILTLNPARPVVEALAVKDGRVMATGDAATILELRGRHTTVQDAAGKTMTPGLIDAHLHPIQGLEQTAGLDLGGVSTFDELLRVLRAEADLLSASQKNPWVRAWNLDYAVLRGEKFNGAIFDDVVRGLPALIILFDGHTAWASSQGLREAGITGSRTFSDASEIVVDEDGRPTGELREMPAYEPILRVAPKLTYSQTVEKTQGLLFDLARSGITGGCIMDGKTGSFDLLSDLDDKGLPIRIVSALDHEPGFDEEMTQQRLEDLHRRGKRWRGGLVKLYADGVVETGTAWLHDPDSQGGGLQPFWKDHAAYERTVAKYASAGFQVATHAIGDRAVSAAIDAYLKVGAISANGASHRIEHLEIMTDRDVARLAATGITASMQPLHLQWRAEDGGDDWASRLGPARTRTAWRIGDVVRSGANYALGSDWPIASNDARAGLAWSILRRTPGQREGFVFEPEQRLSFYEALYGYTLGAARAQGDFDLGALLPGYHADWVIWDENPMEVDADDLLTLPIHETVVGGEPTYRSGS